MLRSSLVWIHTVTLDEAFYTHLSQKKLSLVLPKHVVNYKNYLKEKRRKQVVAQGYDDVNLFEIIILSQFTTQYCMQYGSF
jgi:hypothetical protein